ncbi:hypothetical protein MOUN0_L02674 [Monosporozyma unispora]
MKLSHISKNYFWFNLSNFICPQWNPYLNNNSKNWTLNMKYNSVQTFFVFYSFKSLKEGLSAISSHLNPFP